MPAAIAKASIEKIPIIGKMGRQIGCIYVDRENVKKDVVQMTKERQIQAE